MPIHNFYEQCAGTFFNVLKCMKLQISNCIPRSVIFMENILELLQWTFPPKNYSYEVNFQYMLNVRQIAN